MSQALVSPSPATSLRRLAVRVWNDPDSRSTTIGIVGVLLVHLLILLLSPHMLRLEHAPSILRPHASNRQFNIEIAPETFARPVPKPPAPKQFVETNPDAPENVPDKTNNFGAQNQQVAQTKATPNARDDSERPMTEGKKDMESTQIVSGSLHKQIDQPPAPPVPQVVQTPPTPSAPRAEQNPLPGTEKLMGDNPTGVGTNVSKDTANARSIPEKIEGEKDVPLIEGATGLQPAIDRNHPRPRPSLVKQPQVRPAVLADHPIGTKNIGQVIAINSKFSEYGLYLQRMADAVQLEFDRVVGESATYPPNGSYVQVRFILDSHGNIPRVVQVDSHTSDLGARMAVAAITNRAPYGEWTDDMKTTLNADGEELIFTFYYQ